MKALTVTVASLSSQMSTVMGRISDNTSPETSNPNASSSPFTREKLFLEMREFDERKKRADSIIVRGIEASNASVFASTFKDVCTYLGEANAVVSDIFCVSSANKIFRLKIPDKTTRQNLLTKSNTLKDHNIFGGVFLSRDLTYMQRSELREKRAAERLRVRNADSVAEPSEVLHSQIDQASHPSLPPPQGAQGFQ